jgi:hypothetical protein
MLHPMTPTGFPAVLPAPRRPDPLDVPALRWGVLGTGGSPEVLVADPGADVVYVATPHQAYRVQPLAHRHAEVEHQQGHDDGEDAVAEGGQPVKAAAPDAGGSRSARRR